MILAEPVDHCNISGAGQLEFFDLRAAAVGSFCSQVGRAALGTLVSTPFPTTAVAGRVNSADNFVGRNLAAFASLHSPGKYQGAGSSIYRVGPGDSGQRGASPFIKGGKLAGVCFFKFHSAQLDALGRILPRFRPVLRAASRIGMGV